MPRSGHRVVELGDRLRRRVHRARSRPATRRSRRPAHASAATSLKARQEARRTSSSAMLIAKRPVGRIEHGEVDPERIEALVEQAAAAWRSRGRACCVPGRPHQGTRIAPSARCCTASSWRIRRAAPRVVSRRSARRARRRAHGETRAPREGTRSGDRPSRSPDDRVAARESAATAALLALTTEAIPPDIRHLTPVVNARESRHRARVDSCATEASHAGCGDQRRHGDRRHRSSETSGRRRGSRRTRRLERDARERAGTPPRIDARGKIVAPGFVDIHTHYDAQVFWDPVLSPSPLPRRDHRSWAATAASRSRPSSPRRARTSCGCSRGSRACRSSPRGGRSWDWRSFGEYLDRLEGRIAVNAGFLVGHSALRRVVMGEAAVGQEASEAQLDAMARLLGESIAAGGLGFSSSFAPTHNDGDGKPVPSRFATREELLRVREGRRGAPGHDPRVHPRGRRLRGDPQGDHGRDVARPRTVRSTGTCSR